MQLRYSGNITYADFLVTSANEASYLSKQLFDLNNEINADLLFLASVEKSGLTAKTAVVLSNGEIVENFCYLLDGSPCEQVLENEVCCIPSQVVDLYPKDLALVEMSIEGYLGVPILNDVGRPIGILVGLYFSAQPDMHQHRSRFKYAASFFGAFLQKSFLEKKANLQLTLLDEIEELSNVGAWEYQVATNELYWSKQVYRIHGIEINADLSVSEIFQHYEGNDGKRLRHMFEKAVGEGEGYCGDFKFIDAMGNKKWTRTSAKIEKDTEGRIIRVYGAFEDVTIEKAMLASETEKFNRLNSILNNLNDAVVIIDKKGTIVQVNTVALQTFEYKADEILGKPVSVLMPESYASKHDTYMAKYEKTGEATILGIGRQLPARRKNGDVFQMELSVTKTFNDGHIEYIGVIRDISERILAQDTIYNLAYSDSITGLKNKRWFEKECSSLLQNADNKDAYIYAAIIDIDKLSQFNLKYGMKTGNEALKQIAKKLIANLNKACQIYKNGADSFLVLSNTPNDDLCSIEKLQVIIDSELLVPDVFLVNIQHAEHTLSASVGSAILNTRHQSYETLLDTLEYAIKQAKLSAPFGYYFADDAALVQYQRTKTIQSLIAHVSANSGFKLVLQPQYDASHQVRSSEALLRWQTPELGTVSPLEFIPIAEQSGAIIGLGNWVLSEVCQILHELKAQGIETCVSVNISVKQIISPDFASNLMVMLRKWRVAPNQLMLELTETTLVSDIDLVKSVMLDLNQKGFKFSIDDFGTGYSSLSYLKELPIAELKIDKSFVDGIIDSTDRSSCSIVNMIIDMAAALGVNSVAEGVEYSEQYDYLKSRGCDFFQGYLLSRPLEVSDWKAVLLQAT